MISGVAKLTKSERIDLLKKIRPNFTPLMWPYSEEDQKIFDSFSENTVLNFTLPMGIAPNFFINGEHYIIPMVVEESSVVAAASSAAKFWAQHGGFHTEILGVIKTGQVHFLSKEQNLIERFLEIKNILFEKIASTESNMKKRGGGVLDIELIDARNEISDYYRLNVIFDTCNAMGANFINSVLEELALHLSSIFVIDVIMSILSNYTPNCLVRSYVECDRNVFDEDFIQKFDLAVKISKTNIERAVTHNKGIMNGIDALMIATANDFRATSASIHAYAARDGHYKGLTDLSLENNKFKFSLEIPLALGTVGGLTNLHKQAKEAFELLGNPSSKKLMEIAASLGLAMNFAALKSLTTTGIQKGHMRMHLFNIGQTLGATDKEIEILKERLKNDSISIKKVRETLMDLRGNYVL